MIRWSEQIFLVIAGVILVGLAVAYALDLQRRKRILTGEATPLLARMTASASLGKKIARTILVVLGATLVAVSLARPQVEGEARWRRRGFDVALVMDFSKSMLAEDVYPSRIERAKIRADRIIDSLGGGDRVAVVAFGGGVAHYPLTTDHEAAKILFAGLSPLDLPGGSDLGGGVLRARCLLRPDLTADPECRNRRGGAALDPSDRLLEDDAGRALEDRARAMILLTDGEDTEGEARAQIEAASKLGIEVFVVGFGTPQGGPVPDFDRYGRRSGWKTQPGSDKPHLSRLEEAALSNLAAAGGGEENYFRDNPRDLGTDPLVETLERLKRGELEERVLKRYDEAFQFLLYPAFMLLLVEACISDRRRQKQGRRLVA